MYVGIYRYRVYIKKMSRKIKYGRLSLLNIFETVNEVFDKETNKHEYIKLFGRITNILKKVITKHRSYDLFVVGFSRRNKLKIYEQIFENHFKDEFDLLYGKSQYHPNGESLFIIRKRRVEVLILNIYI